MELIDLGFINATYENKVYPQVRPRAFLSHHPTCTWSAEIMPFPAW
jgi:hypothetical protein